MDNKEDDFSRTTIWKKGRAAEEARHNSVSSKITLIIGTGIAVAVVAAMLYFFFKPA